MIDEMYNDWLAYKNEYKIWGNKHALWQKWIRL